MKYVMGIDLGTSAVKTALFDQVGKLVSESTKEYPLYQPYNGWAEQDPNEWWKSTISSIKEVINNAYISSEDIVGIGLSGQMHGLVMLDEKYQVIRNSIIWCDQRSFAECDELTKIIGKNELIRITANLASTGFTASKLLWIRNNEPENYKRCKHILLPKDYIRFKLTGNLYTEYSDASGTQFLDIKNRCWSTEILNKLNIPLDWLPELRESVDDTGTISEEVSVLTGISTKTITVGGAGDNAASAVGVGTVKDGKAFTTIGTSGVVYAHSKNYIYDEKCRVHTFCSAVKNQWHVMGVTQAAGLSMKWFRDTLCQDIKNEADSLGIDPYVIMNKYIDEVQIGSNKLFYLPYLMGERTPHLDPYCRGVFFGLSCIHSRNDMMRAVMEGVSYSLRECNSILEAMNINVQSMTVCGGGAKSVVWQQMLADNYKCNITTLNHSEGAVFGAAILAMVGCGLYDSVEQACSILIESNSELRWNFENSKKYDKLFYIYQNLYISLKENFMLLDHVNLTDKEEL